MDINPIKDPNLIEQINLIKKNDWRCNKLSNRSGSNYIKIDDKSAIYIADAISQNDKVKEISFPNANISNLGIIALAQSFSSNQKLTILDLSYNNIQTAGMWALGTAFLNNPTLKSINLSFNGFQNDGGEALANLICTQYNLQELTCDSRDSFSVINLDGFTAISDVLKMHTALTKFSLNGHNAGDAGAVVLFTALQYNTSLKEIFFSNNCVGDKGAKVLADTLKVNFRLNYIDLSINMISDAGLTALSNGLSNNNSLTNLSIWRNRFCADGAKSLGIALAINSSIKIITINMNSIGVEGALAIANGLESNSSLVELNVAGNGIGNQGAIHLALALQKNSSVDKLGLCNNNIGDEGAVALALALDNKPCFKSLDLHTNKIGIQGGNAFLQLLKNSFHRGHPSWIDFWLDFNPVKNENVFHELEGQRKKNYEYLNDFKAAVEREDVNKVQGFLDKGLNIDAQDNDGYTALHHSARYGSVKMVKYLVDHGACITKPTPFNHTALDLAKELNHTKVIEFLSTCLNTRHDSPLAKVEKASLNRDSKVVSVVYKLPAQSEKLSVDSTKLISTLQSSLKGDIKEIIKAAAKGDIEALVSYVSQGIDIDAIGSNGVTPLMSAVYVGQLDTVKWFSLQKNINFEKRNNYGYTLFLISAVGGKLDIGKWLIEQKSTRLNDLDYNHNTPFMLASYHGHLAFVEWLVNEKFQIHIAASKGIICANNIYGQNAIQLATIAGKLHVLKWLAAKLTIGNSGKWFTENQSYYTCVDKTGNTLLHLAAYYGHQHIVEWIVEAKITNVGSLNRDKQTASEVAEYNGYTDVAEFLNACHSNSSSTFHAVSPKSKKTEEAVVQKIVTSSIKPDSSLSEYLELDAGSKQLQEQFASSPEGSNLSRLTSPSIPLLKPSKPLAKGIVKPAPLKTYDNDVKESAELDARLKIMQERIEAVPKPKNTPHAETYTILNKPIAILKPSKPLAKGIVNPAPLKTYDNDVKESAELDALLKIMQERIEAIPKPKGLPTPIPNTNSNKPIPLVKSSKPQAQGLFKPAYVKSERAESETPTELPYRLKKAPQQR